MQYTRVYSDAAGDSHFEDVDVPMTAVSFAPPAPPMDLSAFSSAARVGFLRASPDWIGDWHPAPKRQWMIYLAGRVEAEVTGGERREFGPGSVTLVEDTTGTGHRSRVVGPDDVVLAVVQIDEDEPADESGD